MSTREDYRQFARDCLRLAEKEKDDVERRTLLEMADAWTLIALEAAWVPRFASPTLQ